MTDASGSTGSSEGTGGDATGQQGTEGQAAQSGTGQEGQAQQGQEQQQGEQQQHRVDTSAWPAEAREAYDKQQRDIAALRRERGDERINAKTKAAEDGARKALAEAAKIAGLEIPGLTDVDEGKGDPQVLAQQITQTTTERDAAKREAATVRAAMEAGVDPTKLDYLQFRLSRDAQYAAIDLASADLGAKVRASIDALLAQDSTLKLTGSAVASGVENHGGANGSDKITPERFARMTIAERQELYFADKPLYDQLSAAE